MSIAAEDYDPFAVENDSYSMPAVFKPKDFYSLSRLFIQPGNSMWQADNYQTAELTRVSIDGREWVRWRFARKTDAFIPSLAYRCVSRIGSVRFSVRVLNRSREPIAFSGWGQNDPETFQTVQPGEEQLVTLDGMPTLVAQGTQMGVEHEIYLRDLTIYYPEADGLSVTALTASDQMAAGGKIRFDVAIEGSPENQTVDIEVRTDHWVVWRIRLSAEETVQLSAKQKLAIDRDVPWYLSPGEVTFGLTANGRRAKGVEGRTTVANGREPELPRLERREHNGRPTFFLNGEPFNWHGYATYFNISPAAIQEFADSGANLFHIACAPGRHFHNVSAPTWLGGDAYDFGEVEQWATTILQANPDARIIMRLALGLPPFWFQEHPDSLVRIQTTDGREMVYQETDSTVATLTSEAWREQQALALRKLIQYCASRPWASQVVGFNLGGAMTEEWFAWGSCDEIINPVKIFSDYSPVNQEAFRQWCVAKGYPYKQIPEPSIRNRPGYDLFPDDENGRWAAAYNAFINEATAETLLYFADVVKDETERRSLVGAFLGYVILLTGEARQSTAGQFGLRQALESEDIDFLSGVPQFVFRHLTGIGYAAQPTAVSSLLAHGKQYVDDNDLFSWLHEKHWFTEYDKDDPRGAAIEMHRRWMAMEAVHGSSTEWFSLSPKWHHDEQLMAEYGKEAGILIDSVQRDRSPIEEVALVVDDHSFSWLTPGSQAHYPAQMLMGALGRTGAPLGVWLLSDIDRLPERIKFVAVVNSSAPRDEELQKLKALIERGGRTLLIVGTPGLVDEATQRWVPERVGALLGMPIRLDEGLATGRATLHTGQLVSSMDTVMQSHGRDPAMVRPRAYLAGEGFMDYDDGKVAAGERPLANGGRLIWCGVAPCANEPWLREQLIAAGVHCYAPPPCSVHASKDLVAITSVFADDRDVELTWPEEVVVTDILNDWRGEGTTMTCPFKHGQTRLFSVTKP